MISPSKRRAAGSNANNNNNKANNPTNTNTNSSKRSKTTHCHAAPVDTTTTTDSSNTSVLDLHRLLHVMETDPSPTGKTAHDLLLRADWLREQFHSMTTTTTREDCSTLAERVEAAYQAAQRAALALQPQQSVEDDPVQKIFFPKAGTAKTETHSNLVDNAPNKDKDKKPAAVETAAPTAISKLSSSSSNGVTNVQALQRQQQEQMEEAVAAMAQQMKHQTAQIHAQLKQQTVTLTDLEDVATQNVESVTKVAQRTQQHNRTAWGKTIGKWTLLFTVLAAFVATLLTISLVPKRPNACLFFCKSQQQFCRMVHGKHECLDDAAAAAAAAATTVRPEKTSPTMTQDTTTTTTPMTHPEPPVVEVAAAVVMDQDNGRPQIQESIPDALPVMRAQIEANDEEEEYQEEENDEDEEEEEDEEYQEEEEEDEDEDEPLPHQDPVFHQAALAAATGTFKELRRILRDRPDLLNVQDNNGWTLLMEASLNGKTEAVRVLLTLQADALMETYEGRHTALTLAEEALGAEHSVVTLLRTYVAESVEDGNGAQQQEQQEQECQLGMDGECLSTTTADTEPAEKQQQQPVPAASAEEIRQEALREYYAQQQNHHERNPDEILDDEEKEAHHNENTVDYDAATDPLEVASWQVREAAERGDYDQLSQYIRELRSKDMLSLLEEGDTNGWNALHLAARAGHGQVLELLLSAGVHAKLETNSGTTALELALQHHGEEHAVTELLVQYQ